MENLITLEHVSFGYEKESRILSDISLEVRKGEILGLAGKNGSGKSTLLKILAGFLTDYEGSVSMSEDIMKNIACVIDTPAIFEDLSVRNNIEMAVKLAGKQEMRRPDETFIEQMDLEQFYKLKASKLSLGNKQKLALCLALTRNTRLALLDEPFNGIDPIGKTRLIRYLKKRAEEGMTFVITSHIKGDLELLCSRVIEIGKIGENIHEHI